MKPLIIGNWKMNGTQASCLELASAIAADSQQHDTEADVVLAPPFTALVTVKSALTNTPIKLAAQNCHWEQSGAFTGEISPAMLKDCGCDFVILGHSERRHILHETDEVIAKKLSAAGDAKLRTVLCVGETLDERQSGRTENVIDRQLEVALKGLRKAVIESLDIAYEPVWAIGTGKNATAEQATEVHQRIRQFLLRSVGSQEAKTVRILYGGSVNPQNAAGLLNAPAVDGVLVGGASLKAETFLPIVHALS
jgi:triosephosphate isomerase (TIM)